MDLHQELRLCHLGIILVTIGLAWGYWKVQLFKRPNAKFIPILLIFASAMVGIGLIVHYLCGVRTKLGYLLRLTEKPVYTLY